MDGALEEFMRSPDAQTPDFAVLVPRRYWLICRVGDFNLRNTRQVLVLGAGMLVMSLMLAHTFGRLHGGL